MSIDITVAVSIYLCLTSLLLSPSLGWDEANMKRQREAGSAGGLVIVTS